MSDLVVVSFPDEQTAFELRAKLSQLQKEYLIDMEDVVVVTKDANGKVKMHQAVSLTAMGAVGEGRWDGLWGLIGMLAGAALYAEAYPLMMRTVLTWGDLGKITLPGILGISHWIVVPIFVIAGVGLFYWFEKKNL